MAKTITTNNNQSKLNKYVIERCALNVGQLAQAIGCAPQTLSRAINNPLNYLSFNQLVLLSYYLNVEFKELLSIVVGEVLVDVSFPPLFFDAVRKRNLKIKGECVGNMLRPIDDSEIDWFDK